MEPGRSGVAKVTAPTGEDHHYKIETPGRKQKRRRVAALVRPRGALDKGVKVPLGQELSGP